MKPGQIGPCSDCGSLSPAGENGEDVCRCGGRIQETIDVRLSLPDGQAWALAQLVKGIGWSELRGNAESDQEAYVMRSAVAALQGALADAGFAPR